MKDEIFDEEAMKMVSKKVKTEQEISDEIEAKIIAKQQLDYQIRNRVASSDIY
jgi:hypothetical protein